MSQKTLQSTRPIIFEDSHTAIGSLIGAIADQSYGENVYTSDFKCQLGDFVEVSASVTLTNLLVCAKVTAEGQITITYGNVSGAPITPGAHTLYIRVERRASAPPN